MSFSISNKLNNVMLPLASFSLVLSMVADTSHARDLFVDAAADSGLDFTHFSGMTGEWYFAEMMGAGTGLFDYDNDGDLDIYLVQGNMLPGEAATSKPLIPPDRSLPLSDRLYRNDGRCSSDRVRPPPSNA